ncbi:MAG: AMP-binding protein [Betaproteobacteria bacterium]|nr:AMP-binding protein [Betaproteobacteria bacterium]
MSVSPTIADTLPGLLAYRQRQSPDLPAYREWTGPGVTGDTWTWGRFGSAVSLLAARMAGAGLRPGDRLGILSPTSMRWELVQMAALACGASVVGLDPHHPAETVTRLIENTETRWLAVDREERIAGIGARALGALEGVVLLAGDTTRTWPAPTVRVEEIVARPHDSSGPATPGIENHSRPDGAALVTFSSGTTGTPKPIEYTHAQVLHAVQCIVESFPRLASPAQLLCWLPLANLFQRMIDFCAMARGDCSWMVGDPRAVMDAVRDADPHLFVGVPRFFERVHAGASERIAQLPGPAGWFTRRCVAKIVGKAHRRRLAGQTSPRNTWIENAVASRLRELFGRNIQYLVSGSAPLAPAIHDFFDAIGIPVYEAYGVSENVVPIALNRPGARRPGSVGRPVSRNEVSLSAEGEIMVRGPGVFSGYLGTEGTAPKPDASGYWATGDLGAFDDDGYLYVKGRKSDEFKLSTGRWVSPPAIERHLAGLHFVDHAVIGGESRKAVIALLVLSGDHDWSRTSRSDMERQLAQSLRELAGDLPSYQVPAGILLRREPLSIADGELTTNLKVRRRAIWDRHQADTDALYDRIDKARAEAPDANDGVVTVFTFL